MISNERIFPGPHLSLSRLLILALSAALSSGAENAATRSKDISPIQSAAPSSLRESKIPSKSRSRVAPSKKKRRALSSIRKRRVAKRALKSQPLFPPEERETAPARGVILQFHSRPKKQEMRRVAGSLKNAGLYKARAHPSPAIRLFEWRDGLRSFPEAQDACESLPDILSLKYCEPDTLLPPRDSDSGQESEIQPYSYTVSDDDLKLDLPLDSGTEGMFSVECPYCKEESDYDRIQSFMGDLNIRSCGLISDERGLMKTPDRLGGEYVHSLRMTGFSEGDGEEAQLSDYWAQEMIGADLLREELEKTPPPKTDPFVAVLDNGSHGRKVRNLITGDGSQSVLPRIRRGGEKISLLEAEWATDFVTQAGLMEGAPPSFINHSMGWYDSKIVYEAFKKISPPSVVTVAAGNGFHRELEKIQVQASKDFDVILTGSLSPLGSASDFSQSGEEVHILAPSDKLILSGYGGKAGKEDFGWTSAAAPLVVWLQVMRA